VPATPGPIGEDERVPTGNPELDAILSGGLIPRRPYLVVGPSGTGKTTLGLQFLCEGVRRGEEVLLVTLEEPPNEIRENHRSMAPEIDRAFVFDAIPDVMRYERAPFKDIAAVRESVRLEEVPLEIRKTPELTSVEVTFTALEQTLKMEIARRNYARLVIDSLTALQYFCMKGVDETQGAQSFLRFLSDLRITTLLTVESPTEDGETPERLLARGEIRLFRWEEEGRTVRAIGVEKFRGSAHDVRLHPYRLSARGLDINLNLTIARDTRLVVEPLVPEVLPHRPVVLHANPDAADPDRIVRRLKQDLRDLVSLGLEVNPVRDAIEPVTGPGTEVSEAAKRGALATAVERVNRLIVQVQDGRETGSVARRSGAPTPQRIDEARTELAHPARAFPGSTEQVERTLSDLAIFLGPRPALVPEAVPATPGGVEGPSGHAPAAPTMPLPSASLPPAPVVDTPAIAIPATSVAPVPELEARPKSVGSRAATRLAHVFGIGSGAAAPVAPSATEGPAPPPPPSADRSPPLPGTSDSAAALPVPLHETASYVPPPLPTPRDEPVLALVAPAAEAAPAHAIGASPSAGLVAAGPASLGGGGMSMRGGVGPLDEVPGSYTTYIPPPVPSESNALPPLPRTEVPALPPTVGAAPLAEAVVPSTASSAAESEAKPKRKKPTGTGKRRTRPPAAAVPLSSPSGTADPNASATAEPTVGPVAPVAVPKVRKRTTRRRKAPPVVSAQAGSPPPEGHVVGPTVPEPPAAGEKANVEADPVSVAPSGN
jgi:KaiC/GvpD/RAD55 family RecA-like ATPase